MNILQTLPNQIFIEDEEDVKFLSSYYLKNGKNIESLEIGKIIKQDLNNTYIVKPLDTISSIAKKLNLSQDEVISRAGGKNIFIGQKISF